MNNSAQTAEQGAALALLGNDEKRSLAILCRRAWERLGRPGGSFDNWRRQQIMQCCERPGLRQARHEDYNHIRAQMLRILGRNAAADRADLRGATERRRQALAKLKREYAAARHIDKPQAYVSAIARAKFKTTLIETDLSANQIWQLIFSLRNAETRKSREVNHADA